MFWTSRKNAPETVSGDLAKKFSILNTCNRTEVKKLFCDHSKYEIPVVKVF
jgi:hypothetical protein